jgi:beta-lactamase superfamily II metal-dependent hydrolase
VPDSAGLDAPAEDEVEVSVFGPGIGEAIAVHLGNGDWMTVDSCRQPGDKDPAVIKYLKRIGVNVGRQVRLVVASHWHDDHIKGLADTLAACTAADFACSLAMTTSEFVTLVTATGQPSRVESSGVDEFRDVLSILGERQASLLPAHRGPSKYAQADTLLHSSAAGDVPSVVYALSPSPASTTLAIRGLAGSLPQAGDPPRRVRATTPNHAAVVLWVKIGSVEVLLGSDLEIATTTATGWGAVRATAVPKGKAAIFKVPHHGSQNADDNATWEQLVAPEPMAAVTPFLPSRLPGHEDLARLRARTPNLFVTSRATLAKPPRRDSAVERTMKEVAKARHVLRQAEGHVRFRIPAAGGKARVDLFGTAYAA